MGTTARTTKNANEISLKKSNTIEQTFALGGFATHKMQWKDETKRITIKHISLDLLLGILQLIKSIISIFFDNAILNRAEQLHKDIVL